jgi:hypothetical protein
MSVIDIPDSWFERLGLKPPMLQAIGKLTAMAAMIEQRVEHVIWQVEGHVPAGQRHWTDGKPISALIERLRASSDACPDADLGAFLALWCDAAVPAFKCRNNLFHGVASGLGGEWVAFRANHAAKGEKRNRRSGEFMATEHTMTLICQVFAALLRGIVTVDRKDLSGLSPEALKRLQSGLRDARSAAWELEDLVSAVNHEKY